VTGVNSNIQAKLQTLLGINRPKRRVACILL
jgi:hypothetical protein